MYVYDWDHTFVSIKSRNSRVFFLASGHSQVVPKFLVQNSKNGMVWWIGTLIYGVPVRPVERERDRHKARQATRRFYHTLDELDIHMGGGVGHFPWVGSCPVFARRSRELGSIILRRYIAGILDRDLVSLVFMTGKSQTLLIITPSSLVPPKHRCRF